MNVARLGERTIVGSYTKQLPATDMFCATAMIASVNRPLPEAVVSAISASTAVKANDKYALDIASPSNRHHSAIPSRSLAIPPS